MAASSGGHTIPQPVIDGGINIFGLGKTSGRIIEIHFSDLLQCSLKGLGMMYLMNTHNIVECGILRKSQRMALLSVETLAGDC